MDDYENLYKDVSNQNVDTAELERRKKERYQNRFNYYNSVVATLALILSIIGTVGTRIVWIFGLFPAHRSLSFLFISYPVSWILTILMQAVCFCFVRKHVHQSVNRDLA